MSVIINYDNIPDEIKGLRQWVCANSDNKLPMKAWENKPASSTNAKTWTTFEDALYSVEQRYYDYLGFVFADNGIVGIDIDKGYDEDGLISPLSMDIIDKCQSYTEKSRSGKGFHILLRGNLPFTGRNNLNGVEIYKTSRFFIMTGHTFLFDKIIENQGAINYVVTKYFPNMRDSQIKTGRNKIYSPVWKEPIIDGRIKLRPHYPPILDGSRNICLMSLAGMLHNIGYSKKEIFNELQYVNSIACNPSLHDNELRAICNSVTRYRR